jgi:hypothetical protein
MITVLSFGCKHVLWRLSKKVATLQSTRDSRIVLWVVKRYEGWYKVFKLRITF